MYGNEYDRGPIWEDTERNRRATVLLARSVGLAIAAVVFLAIATSLIVESRVETSSRDDALTFAAAVSTAPRTVIPSLIDAAQMEAIIAQDGRTLDVFVPSTTAPNPEYDRWRIRVRNKAFASAGRAFTSEDPDNETWWHTTHKFREDQVLIVGIPRESGMQLARSIQRIILLASLIAVCGILATWAIAYRRGVVPVRSLVAASEDLRVLGELRTETAMRLRSVRGFPVELHMVAEALLDLERESLQGHRQVDALLSAAGALGGSLDQNSILDSTLDHLERLLGAERSAILRYDVHSTNYEVVAVHGHTDDWLDDMNTALADQFAPTMRAVRERVPVQVTNTESEVVSKSLRDRGRRHGYRSVLAVPLTDELELPTVLVMHSSNAKTYSYDEIELSKSFASVAGAALRNAELFERTDADLQQQTSRLESIVESVEQGLIVGGSDGLVGYANGTIRQLLPADLRRPEGRSSDDVVAAILQLGQAPNAVAAELRELPEGASHWVDVELATSDVATTFRVRKFVVRNAHGTTLGSGQTWTDVSRDRELERMKSGLLAAVSHEFRTPLALIKGYATTLLANDVEWNSEDRRQFLSLVSSEADRLTDLVQRILDMRRIDAGMVSLQLMPVRLGVLVDTVCDTLRHEGDRVVVEPMPEITVDVDAARIATALRNVVENACKYSPADQPVTISAEVSEDRIELIVRDHGPGIDPAISDRLFDTFVRGETGLAALHGGIGLGLALSRGFVEAHEGRLYVANNGGDGAEFRLQLPRTHPPQQPEAFQ